jgi:hypothetical protein
MDMATQGTMTIRTRIESSYHRSWELPRTQDYHLGIEKFPCTIKCTDGYTQELRTPF